MKEVFFSFLNNEIDTKQLEEWLYEQSSLEEKIGEENYHELIGFNFDEKDAKHELQKIILAKIVNDDEFISWKIKNILSASGIVFPKNDLFLYAKSHPNFLGGKTLSFKQVNTNKIVELVFSDKVSQFIRHISELDSDNERFLYLGTYENSYIHLIVKQNNEIWIAYDVIDKEEYFALNIHEAIEKLVVGGEDN